MPVEMFIEHQPFTVGDGFYLLSIFLSFCVCAFAIMVDLRKQKAFSFHSISSRWMVPISIIFLIGAFYSFSPYGLFTFFTVHSFVFKFAGTGAGIIATMFAIGSWFLMMMSLFPRAFYQRINER